MGFSAGGDGGRKSLKKSLVGKLAREPNRAQESRRWGPMGVLSPLLGWCVPAIRCQKISIRCQKISIPAAVQTCVGPVEWVRGTGPAGVRTEVRPGSQTGRFRSRRRDEVATTCLRADERAQARSLFEDRHCRRGHARTLGRPEHLLDCRQRFGQQDRHANRGGVVGGGCFAGRSSEGPRHPIGSLGLHIATILEVQPLSPC